MASSYQAGDRPVPGIRLEKFLGRGGFGQVWAASGPGGTPVAVKVVDLVCSQGAKESKAMRLVKGLRHPHIVPITAIWLKDDEGNVFDAAAEDSVQQTMLPTDHGQARELIVVMGLGDMSLTDRLQECLAQGQGGIPVGELLGYLDDAARAIDFLGARRHAVDGELTAFAHCDIKPQNILLVGGVAQLCDLGLARLLDDTRATRPAVSPAYGSPECLAGAPPGPATDQYSLAVSYVELRTGRLPFAEGASPSQVIHAHVNGQLELGHLPAAEQAVVRRATDRDPSKRFASATALVQALREAALGGSQPTTPWPSVIVLESGRPAVVRRRRAGWLVAAAVAAIAAGAALVALKNDLARQLVATFKVSRATQPLVTPVDPRTIKSAVTESPTTIGNDETGRAGQGVDESQSSDKPVDPADDTDLASAADSHETGTAAEQPAPLGLAGFAGRAVASLADDAVNNARAWQTLPGAFRAADWRAAYVAGLLERAERQRAAGNLAQAVTDWSAALPWLDAEQQIELRWQRGLAQVALERFAPAIEDLSYVISRDPRRAAAYYERARLHAILAGAAIDAAAANAARLAALADFTTVLQLAADNVEARMARATMLVALGREGEAMSDLDTLVREAPRRADAFALRAALFAHLGKLTEAIADCTQALAIDGDCVEAAALRGRAYALTGDWNAAADDYSWVLKHDQGRADIRRARAIALAKLGKHALALADLDALVQAGQADATTWRLKALVHLALGQFEQALMAKSEYQRLSPEGRLVLSVVGKQGTVSLTGESGQALKVRANERLHLERAEAGRVAVQAASGSGGGWIASDDVRPAVDF